MSIFKNLFSRGKAKKGPKSATAKAVKVVLKKAPKKPLTKKPAVRAARPAAHRPQGKKA